MPIFDLYQVLCLFPTVSGKEVTKSLFEYLKNQKDFSDVSKDDLGNLSFFRKGSGKNKKTVLLEAHLDEIGLCVSELLPGGFVKAVPCGGIDKKNLPGTEFTIHGKERVFAVALSVSPHLKGLSKTDKKENEPIILDTGLQSLEEVKNVIDVGDVAVFSTIPQRIEFDQICGRSLDNKASVIALLLTLMKKETWKNDVYFLFSIGEETTSRGVRYFCRDKKIDLCLVLDAGFAYNRHLDETKCIVRGKGPSVSHSDTLSDAVCRLVKKVSEDHAIPLQVIAEPGNTGTSGSALSLVKSGIPTTLISIPVNNMHSPNEIVQMSDIRKAAELVSAFCDTPMDTEVEN